MNIGRRRTAAVMVGAVALMLLGAGIGQARAQAPRPQGFPRVVEALKATPGCLGVDTGETASGRRVIFAWFDSKKSLVGWYHSEAHQKAMKTVYPNQTFDREPLPDMAEDAGPILAIVSVKFAEGASAGGPAMPIASIGVELYTPLPGGIAVGGRFAPETIKVKGLREIDTATAQRRSR